MRLYHYTSNMPESIHGCSQEESSGRKPVGFWVSDCDAGDGWREWCEAEGFHPGGLESRLLVTIDSAKILHLKSISEIDDFTVDFHLGRQVGSHLDHLIDWTAVAHQYSGILISPYQWERRLDGNASDWYYGWDCASGCIWNPDAISSMEIDKSWARKAA